ncbi:uncharacterized protein [Nicotiana tomentosiformis]|uniref:uncharacterized protein isoform X2 n=1 Tax=Nicotiana tomentosiformis TaxID=4098 RepID=UPI00388C69ED
MEEQEMPCDGRKRELVEEDEGLNEEEFDDSFDSEESEEVVIYDYSDDSDFELIDGTKVDPKGFDISVYPGASFNSSTVPLKSYLTDPKKNRNTLIGAARQLEISIHRALKSMSSWKL